MERQIKSVSLKGIIRNTSDRVCEDGSLLEAINLRFRDGSWRGVGDKTPTSYSADYIYLLDNLFYHPVLPDNTYLAHNIDDNHVYTVKFVSSGIDTITKVFELTADEEFSRFTAIGNILLVFTDENKYILYWDKVNQEYVDLSFIPVPVVNLGHDELKYFDILKGPFDTNAITYPDYGLGDLNIDEYFRILLYANYLERKAKERIDNFIEGFVVVRMAYRLFDGTYILHTQPYIHHVGYHSVNPPYFRVEAPDNEFNVYFNFNWVAKLKVFYHFFNTGTFSLPDHSGMGIIESLDIFCSEPIETFDYSKTIDQWEEDTYYNPQFRTEYINKLLESQLYKVHSIPVSDIIKQAEHNDGVTGLYYYALAGSVIPDMTKPLSTNELLPLDNFSHHALRSECDYQLNSRIHLGNTSLLLSNGYNCLYNLIMPGIIDIPANSGYHLLDYVIPEVASITKFLGPYATPDGTNDFTLYQQVSIKTDSGTKIITSEVPHTWLYCSNATNIFNIFLTTVYEYISGRALMFNPVISYPDYRAFKIRFYYIKDGGTTKHFLADYDLKSLPEQNIAYYISSLNITDGSTGMFYPTQLPLPADLDDPLPIDDIEDDNIIHDTNRMQVSEIFNPFIWPAIHSYRFGQLHNEIIAIEGVQQAMSDSAFGQYPLYVFSESGIFTINHGEGEVLYNTIQALNNEVICNRLSVKSISGAILFVTYQGLKIISGTQVIELSRPAIGDYLNPLEDDTHFSDALTGTNLPQIDTFRTDDKFMDYIQYCKIFFDVYNNEVILCNQFFNYSYVYSLENKTWSTITEVFTDEMFIAGRWIGVKTTMEQDLTYTFSLHYLDEESTEESTLCKYLMFQTRPLHLGSVTYKRIDKLILRAEFTNPENEYAVCLVYASNDLNEWNVLTYQQISEGGDVYINRLLGNYKYFIVVFSCARHEAAVHQIDFLFGERFAKLMK